MCECFLSFLSLFLSFFFLCCIFILFIFILFYFPTFSPPQKGEKGRGWGRGGGGGKALDVEMWEEVGGGCGNSWGK